MRENFERDEYVFKIYAPICSLYFANVVIRRREKLKNNIYIHVSYFVGKDVSIEGIFRLLCCVSIWQTG